MALPDITYFINLFVFLLMFLSPIGFKPDMLPSKFAWVLYANPIYYMTEMYRDSMLYGRWPSPLVAIGYVVMCVATFAVGSAFFERFGRPRGLRIVHYLYTSLRTCRRAVCNACSRGLRASPVMFDVPPSSRSRHSQELRRSQAGRRCIRAGGRSPSERHLRLVAQALGSDRRAWICEGPPSRPSVCGRRRLQVSAGT